MIINPRGRAEIFRRWAAWLNSLGRKESAEYWQKAADNLERKEVMTMSEQEAAARAMAEGYLGTKGPKKGLHDKYAVIKTDGMPVDPNAFYFVLRPDTDAAAWWAAQFYAQLCRAQNPQLAEDLEKKLQEIGMP